MNCPKCNSTMDTINFNNIEVDRCTDCKGIWFDAGEKEALKAESGSEEVDAQQDAASIEGNEIDCPKCSVRMFSNTKDLGGKWLTYEYCDACGGAFFDPGEFEDFKNENSWQGAFANAFSKSE